MDELTREFLIESQEGLDRMEHCLTDLETRPGDTGLLAEIFRAVHTIKGTTGFLGFTRLETLAHAGENLLALLREGKLAADSDVITGLLQLLDGLRSILKIIESTGSDHEGESKGADAGLISRLKELQTPPESRESVIAPSAVTNAEPPAPPKASPAAASAAPSVECPPPSGAHAPSTAESTLRVDITLLNRMMNLVGELVLTRNQVLQATSADPRMTMLSRRLDMVTADLREAVMKARMQPVENIFSKMPRLVRDLGRQLGRRVRLEMEGQDTELDKSLLEAIKDPLTHAVRNALDHGIEPEQTRAAAGKDPEGVLRLRAAQQGSHVIIEVSDDGAGIDVERIRAKAIERGLITEERAAQQSERELLQMIFLPGFSTAAAVTNVSGRGVGMDVVRTNVERIGGKVELDSRPGEGTTLRLRIPLTLAIIPALIVRNRNQSFALPQGALSELVHATATAIEWIEDAPLYRLRGNLLPLVFLDQLLSGRAGRNEAAARERFIAVLDADGRHFGLVVDGLADPEEIVVKPLSTVLKKIGLYSGATVLGNAELALILDPGAIAQRAGIRMAEEDAGQEMSESGAAPAGGAQAEYLLVEIGGRPAAIALERVIRIEQLAASRIEYLGSRAVVNFEEQLVPVEDAGGLLAAAQGAEAAPIVVVICRDGGRHIGIAVTHVLDVAAGRNLFEAGTGQLASGVTLLKERVTGVVGLEAMGPVAAGQEEDGESVALLEEGVLVGDA